MKEDRRKKGSSNYKKEMNEGTRQKREGRIEGRMKKQRKK
jgi:hypothetical protein